METYWNKIHKKKKHKRFHCSREREREFYVSKEEEEEWEGIKLQKPSPTESHETKAGNKHSKGRQGWWAGVWRKEEGGMVTRRRERFTLIPELCCKV